MLQGPLACLSALPHSSPSLPPPLSPLSPPPCPHIPIEPHGSLVKPHCAGLCSPPPGLPGLLGFSNPRPQPTRTCLAPACPPLCHSQSLFTQPLCSSSIFSVVVKHISTQLGAETISMHYATRLLKEGIRQREAGRSGSGLHGPRSRCQWDSVTQPVTGWRFHIQDAPLVGDGARGQGAPLLPPQTWGPEEAAHTEGKCRWEMSNKTKHSHRGQ